LVLTKVAQEYFDLILPELFSTKKDVTLAEVAIVFLHGLPATKK